MDVWVVDDLMWISGVRRIRIKLRDLENQEPVLQVEAVEGESVTRILQA